MPSSTPPRAVQVTPLQLVFMNHEAPPSIAIDIQSWVRFGSGQLANIAGTLDNANLAGDFKEARNGRSVVGDLGCCCCVHHLCAGSSAKCQPHGFRTAQYRYSCRGVCQCPAGLHVRSASIDTADITAGKRQGHRQEGTGNCYQLQAVLGATGARVRCVLPLARRFCGRRCFDLGSEVCRRHDASAADQCYGRNRIARATPLNGRIKWSWCPRVDKPIARNHARRIRRRDRPRIAFWNPSCF